MTKPTGKRKHYPRHWTLRERFEANVPDRPDVGCWIWDGSTQASGYGQISEGPRGTQRVYLAHRLAYELNVGPVPEGHEVEHVCEVKGCVRWTYDPDLGTPHLAAVTHRQNMVRSGHRIGWGEYWRRRRARQRDEREEMR